MRKIVSKLYCTCRQHRSFVYKSVLFQFLAPKIPFDSGNTILSVTGTAFRAWKARLKVPYKDDLKLRKESLEYRRVLGV
jgi:hypothetical protein